MQCKNGDDMSKKIKILCVAALIFLLACLLAVACLEEKEKSAGAIFVREAEYAKNRI